MIPGFQSPGGRISTIVRHKSICLPQDVIIPLSYEVFLY